jgi:hypothetical protein
MIKLFLKPNDIPALTSFSGNIDIDQLAPCISIAQQTYIKRVLGLNLYNKIYTDIDTLSGEYLYIFDTFIVNMLSFYTVNIYLSLSLTKVNNAGAFKTTVENGTLLTKAEINALSDSYKGIALDFEAQFREYMATITIAEYGQLEQNTQQTDLIQLY